MSESDPTVAELLTAVNAAIYALVTKKVKAYEVSGVRYTYYELDELRKWRDQLNRENRTVSNTIRVADITDA